MVGAPQHVLVVDNHDSFTFNVVRALELAGARCSVFPNDQAGADELVGLGTCGIVLSPGPCTPATAGVSLELLDRVTALGGPPLLGVCLGHQAIAEAFGGTVTTARRPLHGKRVRIHHDRRGCLAALPSPLEVTRYNSLAVSDAGPELEVSARDDDGEIMALRHRVLPIEGVQFHPESHLSPACLPLFATWLEQCARHLACESPAVVAG